MFFEINDTMIEVPKVLFEVSDTLQMLHRRNEKYVNVNFLCSENNLNVIIQSIKDNKVIEYKYLGYFIKLMNYILVEETFVSSFIPLSDISKVFMESFIPFKQIDKLKAMKYCSFLFNLCLYYDDIYQSMMRLRLNLKPVKFYSNHRFKNYLRRELHKREKQYLIKQRRYLFYCELDNHLPPMFNIKKK